MTSTDRLDPLSFHGCFAYLDGDIPPGLTLPAWRSARRSVAGPAGADRAPQGRTLRARRRAHRPRNGRARNPRSDL